MLARYIRCAIRSWHDGVYAKITATRNIVWGAIVVLSSFREFMAQSFFRDRVWGHRATGLNGPRPRQKKRDTRFLPGLHALTTITLI